MNKVLKHILGASLILVISIALAACGDLKGKDGLDGFNGAIGPPGPAGPQGIQGPTGAPGIPCSTPGCVTSADIADGAIMTNHLAAGFTVGQNHIAPGSITSVHIAQGAINDGLLMGASVVTSRELQDGAVGTNQLALGAVTGAKIAASAVGTSQIADASVTQAKLANGAVGINQLATGAVTSAKIATGAVGTNQLADSSVTSAKIADGAIASADIASGAITSTKIAAGSVVTFATPAIATDNVYVYTTTNQSYSQQMPNMTLTLNATDSAQGGHQLIMFDGTFYLNGGSFGLLFVYLCDGATVLSRKAMIDDNGYLFDSLSMHWAGSLAAGNHTINIKWNCYDPNPLSTEVCYAYSSYGERRLSAINFAR